MNFQQLKKNSSSSFDKLMRNMEDMTSKKSGDARFWNPTVDKDGNGSAIIRFIITQNEDIPFIRMFDHGFKSASGAWYIEKSLTTIGQEDPLAQFNSYLWNSTSDEESPLRKQVRNQKRQLRFVSNIYVIKDPGNPANEGKVFLYSYGKKVWNKLNAAMHPEFEDEQPFNPFDLWTGANFRLRISKVAGFRNYDRSEFDRPAPLKENDAALEEIYKQTYSLQELLEPKNFKSYAELDKQLRRVLGAQYIQWASAGEENNKAPTSAPSPPPASSSVERISQAQSDVMAEDLPFNQEESDPMAYYENLAKGGNF